MNPINGIHLHQKIWEKEYSYPLPHAGSFGLSSPPQWLHLEDSHRTWILTHDITETYRAEIQVRPLVLPLLLHLTKWVNWVSLPWAGKKVSQSWARENPWQKPFTRPLPGDSAPCTALSKAVPWVSLFFQQTFWQDNCLSNWGRVIF